MNYDFLTVEDYNNVVNIGYYDTGYYYLPLKELTNATDDVYSFDGFINVRRISSTKYLIGVVNALFTGKYTLFKATHSTITVNSYEPSESFIFELNIDSRDLTDGQLVLLLANVDPDIVNINSTSQLNYILDNVSNNYAPSEISSSIIKKISVLNPTGSAATNTSFKLFLNGELEDTFTTDVNGILTLDIPVDFEGDYILAELKYSNSTQMMFYIISVKSKPFLTLSNESVLYKGLKKAKLIFNALIGQEFDYEIIYNNRRVTGTKHELEDQVNVDLNLNYITEDVLNIKFNIKGINNCYNDSNTFNISLDSLTGDVDLLNSLVEYMPGEFNLTGIAGTQIDGLTDCIVYAAADLSEFNFNIKNCNNVTFKNVKFGESSFINTGNVNLSFEGCNISCQRFLNQMDNKLKITMSDCTIEFKEFDAGEKVSFDYNGYLELSHCTLTRNEYTANEPAFITIEENGRLELERCNFILQYSTNVVDGLHKFFFDISGNAIVNGTKGQVLENNVLPFTNNKSSVDLTLGSDSITSINGVIWTINSTGKVYSQNVSGV